MRKSIPSDKQEELLIQLIDKGYSSFSGVPDSSLNVFVKSLDFYDVSHVRCTWEAEAVGVAAGAFLAGKKACVYMQNSGMCFALNPLTSLCIPYGIDMMLVIGHRHTLPQHKVMGECDAAILTTIGWSNYIFVESRG